MDNRSFQIIQCFLALAPEYGCNKNTLHQATEKAGLAAGQALIVFPGGVKALLQLFSEHVDAAMVRECSQLPLKEKKTPERIAIIIKTRLGLYEPHKQAMQAITNYLASPFNMDVSLSQLWKMVDIMWRLAGHRDTDFNYYTKRLILAGVYSSTLLFWLRDTSENHEASWEFLKRRLENVKDFEKVKERVRSFKISLLPQ